MAYTASLIAYAFVEKGIESGNFVTQMKLQKLVFFAHGLHLAKYDKPLIKEKFQAWKFGPVVPSIYRDYKFYGSSPIADTNYLFAFGDTDMRELWLKEIDRKAKESIDTTWEGLKDTSAVQLSNWTHKEGSPWAQNYVQGINDIVIPDEQIKEYFKTNITKQ